MLLGATWLSRRVTCVAHHLALLGGSCSFRDTFLCAGSVHLQIFTPIPLRFLFQASAFTLWLSALVVSRFWVCDTGYCVVDTKNHFHFKQSFFSRCELHNSIGSVNNSGQMFSCQNHVGASKLRELYWQASWGTPATCLAQPPSIEVHATIQIAL